MRKIVIENISVTIQTLLDQEDTDGDKRITVLDRGPKNFMVQTDEGEDYPLTSTYFLSNLLQELFLELEVGKQTTQIPLAKIEEAPANRISRLIKDYYWNGLTRSLDEKGLKQLIKDTKNASLETEFLRVYVPFGDEKAFQYYQELETRLPIQVIRLPEQISPEYVLRINQEAGILALDLKEENGKIKGKEFVVPGGRFNEMYGWDSYFEAIGLILDGKTELAKNMADHFFYEIRHYGKILNANRTYYLTRTQPPFYSSLVKAVFNETGNKDWLQKHLKGIIQEYEQVWMSPPRLTEMGLNRYYAQGIGLPPETEDGHYNAVLKPWAKKLNLSIPQLESQLRKNTIKIPELNPYFTHDRSVRESGHDTSYRLENQCADLAVVELNALLYQCETDIAELLDQEFQGKLDFQNKTYTSDEFRKYAEERKALINKYLWNEKEGFYFDYNIPNQTQENCISATSIYPLWAKLSSPEQAQKVVEKLRSELLEKGGIVSGTEKSRGEISDERPAKQWDYPYGWPPHQMLIWQGLLNYGYEDLAQELIYRWLYMITKNAVDYSGTIPEKYDVVEATHLVFVEYGNVGTDFDYISKEGFGWMNASFQMGMSLLNENLKNQLNNLSPPDEIF